MPSANTSPAADLPLWSADEPLSAKANAALANYARLDCALGITRSGNHPLLGGRGSDGIDCAAPGIPCQEVPAAVRLAWETKQNSKTTTIARTVTSAHGPANGEVTS